jgi:hypothetical protein
MQKRSNPKLVMLGLALAVLALVVGYWMKRSSGPKEASPEVTSISAPTAAPAPESAADELREMSAAELANAPRPPAVLQAPTRATSAEQSPPPARTEPSPYTRQLVGSLTNLDLSAGFIDKNRADQWKRDLQTLVAQGAAGVPAIREFLELNQELNFSAISGGDLMGETSLRSALINALAQIGGPEAIQGMLQTLQTTTLPSEIALLAQHLDRLAPGQYGQVAVDAIRDVLAMASKGQLSGMDVGPLFQLMQGYGDPAALEPFQGLYRYYATMSLANMESGSGLSSLIHQAHNPSELGDFSFQMLAQISPSYPEAADTLVKLAQANKLSESAWRKVISGLAGDQYLFNVPTTSGPVKTALPGLKTYHIATGNQNFYSIPVQADAQVPARLALIDQLLGSTSNPMAIQSLQAARNNLVNLPPK